MSWLSASRWRGIPVVAVVRLAGIIGPPIPLRGGLSLHALSPVFDRAFALGGIKAIALAINSPGGSAVQSALLAKRIRDLAVEKKLPVIAFAEDVAASGGYWLAAAADEIYATEASIIGSIGVISAGFGFAELLQRVGIERRIYTVGPRKAMLDPFRAKDAGDVARLKVLQTDIHDEFKRQVRERRGARLKADDDALFSGEVWSGRRALELGLIDGLGDMRSVMRARFGDKVQLRVVGGPRGWLFRRLRAEDRAIEWAQALLFAAEERALWARYGL